ncbi:PREDICTED: uncharacterized protein LOC106820986 [Priapulus caudatus]|uniref:Uncharacterized protein LOC106820986 n=1 Tax=Priapulus caudatus TaxID=37621 RepID=A0ABM1F9G9_PRICU|nr:PREDICTED: uncharacterized protein LOC106820986 [Priapulus caudatus]
MLSTFWLTANKDIRRRTFSSLREGTLQRKRNKRAVTRIRTKFMGARLCTSVRSELLSAIQKQFGDHWREKLFAVRSSGVGEDGAEASYAGVLETYLAMKGEDKICDAVIKCWASLYSYNAVQYRRENGQPLDIDIAVVVQEMVLPDAAGVLFTHDSISGSPGSMSINVTYGLGEGVVSGISEPDTFTLNRTFYNKISIKEKCIGRKETRVSASSVGGTVDETVGADDGQKSSLSDELILQLGEIGILVEKSFSDARDIEFAVKDGQIYLLQARPITSLNIENDFEIGHELDTGVLTDHDLFTTGNTGEIIPRSATPLTMSQLWHIDLGSQWSETKISSRQTKCVELDFGIFSGNIMINMYNLGYRANRYTSFNSTEDRKALMEMAIFGKTVYPELVDSIERRFSSARKSILQKLKADVNSFYLAFRKTRSTSKLAVKYVEALELDLSVDKAETLYAAIDQIYRACYVVWRVTISGTPFGSGGSLKPILIRALITNGRHVGIWHV